MGQESTMSRTKTRFRGPGVIEKIRLDQAIESTTEQVLKATKAASARRFGLLGFKWGYLFGAVSVGLLVAGLKIKGWM
jgi:hypothetical protein